MNNIIGDVSVLYFVIGEQAWLPRYGIMLQFDFAYNNCRRDSMLTTVDDILTCAVISDDMTGSSARNSLFSIDPVTSLSSDEDREYFHSMVAKLFFLAN